jgi:hypothetical protein
MPDTPNPVSAAARTGSGVSISLTADPPKIAPKPNPPQAVSCNSRAFGGSAVACFPMRRRWHTPVPRSILVRVIASTDCHEAYGRSRPLRIRARDLPELIAHAEQLEARR